MLNKKWKIIIASILIGIMIPFIYIVTIGNGRVSTLPGTRISIPENMTSAEQHEFFLSHSKVMDLSSRIMHFFYILRSIWPGYIVASCAFSLISFFLIKLVLTRKENKP